ncbi:MAG: D-glycero-beta-D-manno-heptose-7-phosphate kinase, partial [Bacteroidetes bacterium]|nr:D-glycero-beta-D-manno-heptose-7-phosphate kinase [Bacteroidota bacterium]
NGKKVVVDPKKKNFLAYKNVDVMKPNLKELREGLKLDMPLEFSIESVQHAAKKLRQKLGLKTALITLSENGIYIGSDQEQHHIKAHIRDIYDVSGAGDTVIAVASLMLASGAGIKLAAEVANLGGGLVCEKVGVVPVDKQRLLEEALKMA